MGTAAARGCHMGRGPWEVTRGTASRGGGGAFKLESDACMLARIRREMHSFRLPCQAHCHLHPHLQRS